MPWGEIDPLLSLLEDEVALATELCRLSSTEMFPKEMLLAIQVIKPKSFVIVASTVSAHGAAWWEGIAGMC